MLSPVICTNDVKYIGWLRLEYPYMFSNASIGLYWRVNVSHVHNMHSAKYQDHTRTSMHLQRGMTKAWRVERARRLTRARGSAKAKVRRLASTMSPRSQSKHLRLKISRMFLPKLSHTSTVLPKQASFYIQSRTNHLLRRGALFCFCSSSDNNTARISPWHTVTIYITIATMNYLIMLW